jgi:hypothetical protein
MPNDLRVTLPESWMWREPELKVTWPQVVLGPMEITRMESPLDDAIRFRVTQEIRSMSTNGLLPALTFPC